MKKILLIGSLPPPNHGQSIAFLSASVALKTEGDCKIISSSFRASSVLGALYKFLTYYFQVPYYLFIYRPNKIYFLCSRTLVGGLRDLYLLLLCLFSKAEVLNHLHGSDFNGYLKSLSPLYKKIVIRLYKRVNRHAVLIDGMQEQLKSVAKIEDIFVIDNFYQESAEISKYLALRKNVDELRVFYLSSIVTSKGIFELIEAVKIAVSNKVKIKLMIAGGFIGDSYLDEDKTEKKFFSSIKECPFIEYVGVVNSDSKYMLLAESDVLSLPSYYKSEAIPLCILEAMRMGCCILTSRYKYLPGLVKENVNGFLVEPESVNDIVSTLTYISANKANLKAISNENMKTAKKYYSESKYHENIRKFLEVDG
ncbi:glycosyltransferase family 4 protein [Cardiobacterium sp. AH-315-I02]|nr:glycosyltransferase family 4 protein [Cardiobacterium sp. AH-315-I02]